jgi:antirestriction protein ArdC/phage/plasmid primase-like uncharacterized protein
MTDKKPFYEQVAEKLIEQLKAGTAPWQKPWAPAQPGSFLPVNPTTGKRYKGINAVHLISQGHTDPRWMTYRQAEVEGYQVRRGEKGTPIQYWKFSEERDKLDEQGRPIFDPQGKPAKVEIRLERPRVFSATVFNAAQIDGIPAMERKPVSWDPVDRAENILQSSGAAINHSGGNRAFYRLATDSIHLPDKGQFPGADRYYATALHELGHWTGHPSRLDRDLGHPFGSEGYAKEELRAEIASMILGDELGLGHDPGQHAAYVASWIKTLQDDPLEVFRAAAAAEKIQDFVLGLEQKLEQQETQAETLDQAEDKTMMTELVSPEVIALRNELQQLHRTAADFQELGENAELAAGKYNSFLQALEKNLEPFAESIDTHHAAADAGHYVQELWQSASEDGKLSEFLRMNDPDIAAFVQKEPRLKTLLADAALPTMQNEVLSKYSELFESPREDRNQGQPSPENMKERTYLNVPFREKDEAKALGARWDRGEQSWYVPQGVDPQLFAKWTRGAEDARPEPAEQTTGQKRQYLAVPYGERIAAKAAGALWDKGAKSWYVGPKGDIEKLKRWLPENVPGQEQAPAMTPHEEFAEALRSVGAIVNGAHPIMDGKKHRIAVVDDKKGEQAGFYVGHLDGHPAGYIKNNRTGVEIKWKSKGYLLDPDQKARLQADAAVKLQARATEQERLHEQIAQRIGRQMDRLVEPSTPTLYLESKGIPMIKPGVLTDADGKKTYIPAQDVDGKVWTMQYIRDDGTKRFAKDSRKEGCFHAIGGMDELAKAPAIVIAEGYATAGSLSEALGFSTVAAFDSGNLPPVAKALRAKFPDKPIVIAGDNDMHLEHSQGVNPGRTKAREAAKAVKGKAMFPIFAPGELADNPKAFSDFNDLATKSVLGKDGLERQVKTVVSAAVEKHRSSVDQTRKEARAQRQEREPRAMRR